MRIRPISWAAKVPLTLLLAGVFSLASSAVAASASAAPANDEIAASQAIHGFPATVNGTTVGASTLLTGETPSNCAPGTEHSVWFSVRPATAERVALDLAADGALDATVDVFHAVRSELVSVGCQVTDSHGRASLSFAAAKNGLYEIRIAARAASQLAGFSLTAFLPTPAVTPPGQPLPRRGIAGQVDRVQNINAAYSITLHQGVSYLLNLTNETTRGCVNGRLFAPGTTSFEARSVLSIHCGGFQLFTPGPGEGGRYSFEVTPRTSFAGVQRFHLEVAVAGGAETAPGLPLGNYARARGRLDGGGVHVVRLYRLDETTHSNLTLKLSAPDTADFDLQLRNLDGQVLACQCGGSGPQTLEHQLKPGRYYAVVSVRDASAGNFTLVRESRTITATSLSFSDQKVAAGQPLAIRVAVTPAASGPVTVDIERFDPVFGWQFFREDHVFAGGGLAVDTFVPPSVGRWRAKASYGGSRTFSPSAVGHRYLLVT